MADREDIAYLSDIHGETGNLAEFGENGALRDSGKKVSDFVGTSALQTEVQTQVSAATSEIWNAVNGVYAFVAYKSPAWAASTSYTAGSSFCMYNGAGYECTETHVSGSTFDSSKWRLVLTAAGKQTIDALLAGYSTEGKAALTNLAPPFVGTADYAVGQMCVKTISGSPVLVVCTTAGRGDGAQFSQDVTIESNIVARLAALSTDLQGRIPTAVSQLTNDSGYITQADVPTNVSAFTNDADYVAATVVDAEYNTSEHGYVEGDTCTHGGKFYICVQDVSQGAAWDSSYWDEATLKEIVASWSIGAHPDWNEDDPTSPAYIRNKPNIEYRVAELVSIENPNSIDHTFQLQDRAVNVIVDEISDNSNILLLLPSKASSSISRDFYVVFVVDSVRNVPVEVAHASLVDCAGESATIFSLAGEKRVTYRITEISDTDSIFLVSGYDTVYQKMQEIEAALDYLISGGDPGGGDIVSNVYIPEDDNPDLYHRLTATTDEDGNVNIAVDNEGVPKGDFAPSVSIPDEGGLYHKLVAVKDLETGEVNIGVVQEGEER